MLFQNTLLILMDMIMNGSNLKSKYHTISEPSEKQAILTVSQLVMFNSYKRHRQQNTVTSQHHNRNRGTPLAVYLELRVYYKQGNQT